MNVHIRCITFKKKMRQYKKVGYSVGKIVIHKSACRINQQLMETVSANNIIYVSWQTWQCTAAYQFAYKSTCTDAQHLHKFHSK